MMPLDTIRRFASANPIACDWCGRRFDNQHDGIYVFKVNSEGAVACQDCRRKLGMAYGHGPWLFFSDLLRAHGVTAAGTIISAMVARRYALNPEETIQAS